MKLSPKHFNQKIQIISEAPTMRVSRISIFENFITIHATEEITIGKSINKMLNLDVTIFPKFKFNLLRNIYVLNKISSQSQGNNT
jgi:hypothetical protein